MKNVSPPPTLPKFMKNSDRRTSADEMFAAVQRDRCKLTYRKNKLKSANFSDQFEKRHCFNGKCPEAR